jgi:hypothetical protein
LKKDALDDKLMNNRMRWYEQVLKTEEERIIKNVLKAKI